MDYNFTDATYWSVLSLANNKVIKFEELLRELNMQYSEVTSDNLLTILTELKAIHLIYCDSKYENIITVIDVE